MRYFFVLILSLYSVTLFSYDFEPVTEDFIQQITAESENFLIIHSQNYNINNYNAYINCIDKNTNEEIFNVSSPFLTHLFISNDENYIAGITYLNLRNDYQLIILNTHGEYIKKRHISMYEYKLNYDDLLEFIEYFPEQYNILMSHKRIYNIKSCYYIDYFNKPDYWYDLSEYYGLFDLRTFNFLERYQVKNHLSDNFYELDVILIMWFYNLSFYNPYAMDFQFVYENNELIGISLLVRPDERITINIIEN
jgi:hypothetical protein